MSDDSTAKKPSKWGKGKTDPASWWEPGCESPNKAGRPKGSKNQKTLYKEAAAKKISVNFDGEDTTMSKQELAYHQLVQKAASGDLKAIAMMLQLEEKYDPGEATPPTPDESASDFNTLESFIELREKFQVFKKGCEDG